MVDESLADDRVAIVGAKLLYSDGRVQHSGVILGLNGIANHAFVGLQKDDPGYMGMNVLTRDVSAVTGACMLVKKSLFDSIKGFDENLKVTFNDVDICLRLREKGYKVVWTADVIAEHTESISRGIDVAKEQKMRLTDEIEFMRRKWRGHIDLFYNTLFDRNGQEFRQLMLSQI
jgi:GT2 family glycosyltransferase